MQLKNPSVRNSKQNLTTKIIEQMIEYQDSKISKKDLNQINEEDENILKTHTLYLNDLNYLSPESMRLK